MTEFVACATAFAGSAASAAAMVTISAQPVAATAPVAAHCRQSADEAAARQRAVDRGDNSSGLRLDASGRLLA
jgi:hypothetical protein